MIKKHYELDRNIITFFLLRAATADMTSGSKSLISAVSTLFSTGTSSSLILTDVIWTFLTLPSQFITTYSIATICYHNLKDDMTKNIQKISFLVFAKLAERCYCYNVNINPIMNETLIIKPIRLESVNSKNRNV